MIPQANSDHCNSFAFSISFIDQSRQSNKIRPVRNAKNLISAILYFHWYKRIWTLKLIFHHIAYIVQKSRRVTGQDRPMKSFYELRISVITVILALRRSWQYEYSHIFLEPRLTAVNSRLRSKVCHQKKLDHPDQNNWC